MIALLLALASYSAPATVQTLPETVIVVEAPKAAPAMRCGAPRALANDAVMTVRVCEVVR